MEKITIRSIADGEGPEYILLNKDGGVYKVWATAKKYPELIDSLLSVIPENHRIKIAEKILSKVLTTGDTSVK